MPTEIAESQRGTGRVLSWWSADGPMGAPRFVGALLLVGLGLGLAYLAVAMALPDGTIRRLFDLDGEENLPTWFSSVQWFAVSALFVVVADRRSTIAVRRSWAIWILAAVFLGFSVDEVVSGHEFAGRASDALMPDGTRNGLVPPGPGIWVVTVGIPFIVVLGSLLILSKPVLRAPAGGFKRIVTGVIVFFIGALGFEAASLFMDAGSTAEMLEIFFEETFEMFGATLILWGAYLLASHQGDEPRTAEDRPPSVSTSDGPRV